MLTWMTPEEILNHYGLSLSPALDSSVGIGRTVILYQTSGHSVTKSAGFNFRQILGLTLIVFSIGAIISASQPIIKLEANYRLRVVKESLFNKINQPQTTTTPLPSPKAPEFNPLIDPEGNPIVPVNTDFSLIVPSVGINAPIVAGVNPVSKAGYLQALKQGVAHASTSFYPDENGTVYLFSHSTNYEWFIKNLNAVFYYLKNIEPGQLVVVMYRGNRYTYKIREKQIISAKEISYLVPQTGSRNLILQTCWPPGSTWKRMLIFADLVEEKIKGSFENVYVL